MNIEGKNILAVVRVRNDDVLSFFALAAAVYPRDHVSRNRLIACLAWITCLFPSPVVSGSNWPSFRGTGANGIAEGYSTPVTWDGRTSRNIKWKVSLSGLGHSSPVVWQDRLFVTTAISEVTAELKVGLYGDIGSVPEKPVHKWQLTCVEKASGELLWERTAHQGVPAIRRHPKASHANSTPATDGEHVVAFFGSEGLFCYSVEGRLIWKSDLGLLNSGYYRRKQAQWGFGSSPVIAGDKVIVQCDVQEGSFIAALDIRTGAVIWKTPRNDVPTWSTPTVHTNGARAQVIANGYRHIGAYELATGRELWRLRGGGDIPVPTPIVAQGLIFITSAHGRTSPIYAIALDADGDISPESTGRSIAWSRRRGGAYMQTPLVYGDFYYTCQDNGVLSCYRAKTGELVYSQRLTDRPCGFTASPVAADNKLYFTSEEGDVYVVEAGMKPNILAVNSLGETCMATPAISAGVLYFRTRHHLVAVAEKPTD